MLKISRREELLVRALSRMIKMHEMMMSKTNIAHSWYDAETLKEMNEAPVQASQALKTLYNCSVDKD